MPIFEPVAARDGDEGRYLYCELGEACPDYREGLEHAHLIEVTRRDGRGERTSEASDAECTPKDQ